MLISLILLVAGLAGLWIGTRLVVAGAVELATRYQVPEMVVGVTIIAVGSNLPEIVVSLIAAIQMLDGVERSDIIVGSSLGSTIVQGSLVLAATGLMTVVLTRSNTAWFHGTWLFASAAVLGLLGRDDAISRWDGVALLALYFAYFSWVIIRALGSSDRRRRSTNPTDEQWTRARGIPWLATSGGLGVVLFAANITVDGAHSFAEAIGVPDALIAVTIIAIGSSLPELAVSIMGAARRSHSLGVGTLFGANVLDVLMPIGLAALITPVALDASFRTIEIPFILGLAILSTLLISRLKGPGKLGGVLLLAVYIAYISARLLA